ncbi:DNA polymerase IV [Spirochaetia bacterium]|nr:DNA polymerase IV [Spirochaetia bacterium]
MSLFIHADLDAFYASVEQLDRPEYRGKPVIVGGLPADRRSVVSTCSYEARKFGVHAAMPIQKAYQLCPNGIFVRGNMARYKEKSCEVMNIFRNWTPDVQQLSIDEAFLNITGTEKLFGPARDVIKKIKASVRAETGLTVSIGLASNKYLAKIASGISKPDGTYIVGQGEEEAFMLSLPCSKIWGAGRKSQEKFKQLGFKTCRDIHEKSLQELISFFGNGFGLFLYKAVRGKEAASFDEVRASHSISAERTFSYDLFDDFAVETALLWLSHTLLYRLLESKMFCRTVHLKIRYGDFSTESIQETSHNPVTSVNDLYSRLSALFKKKYKKEKGIRLLGAALMNIADENNKEIQGNLFSGIDPENQKNQRKQQLEKCILELNKKFPGAKLKKARLFKR